MQVLFSAPSSALPHNLVLSNHCGVSKSVIPYKLKHINKMTMMIAAKADGMGHVLGISLSALHDLFNPYKIL